jgi:hypothetical protein
MPQLEPGLLRAPDLEHQQVATDDDDREGGEERLEDYVAEARRHPLFELRPVGVGGAQEHDPAIVLVWAPLIAWSYRGANADAAGFVGPHAPRATAGRDSLGVRLIITQRRDC